MSNLETIDLPVGRE